MEWAGARSSLWQQEQEVVYDGQRELLRQLCPGEKQPKDDHMEVLGSLKEKDKKKHKSPREAMKKTKKAIFFVSHRKDKNIRTEGGNENKGFFCFSK
jgi:hypothetical protein